jgi:predicted aldo/keto reductase-like oxidoreductase
MSTSEKSPLTRRSFVQRTGLATGGVLLGSGSGAHGANDSNKELPQRVLGRTGFSTTSLIIGTAAVGFSKHISVRQIGDIVNTSLDEGVNHIDTARHYGKAEEGVVLGLGSRRKETFLATKVWADTIDVAEKSLATSLATLKTDYVDLLYFHSLGNRDVEAAMKPDGVFTWLVKQKKAGKARFIGISGHNYPGRFVPFLESGEVDVMMVLMNFVDRYTYNFEEKALPVARKHNVGAIAMKVFGGPVGGFSSYSGPKVPPMVGPEHMSSAIRYGLGLPGVAAVNLGVHEAQQVSQNVKQVKNYRPLDAQERADLSRLGRKMADEWGPHFGKVARAECGNLPIV